LQILVIYESQTWSKKFDVSKISAVFRKNCLYCAFLYAESESGLRKILKNFPGTLESHKVSRHFANLAITFWDSCGPPTYYTFFWPPRDALSNWLSKKAETTF